jgi:hypothetical protein
MEAMRQVRSGKQTLQNILAYNLAERRKEDLLKTLEQTDRRHLQVFCSLKNTHGGAWLDARPTEHNYVLSNEEYLTALRTRLYMPIPRVRDLPNKFCQCGAHIDNYGYHFVTGCPRNNASSKPHNHVQHSLEALVRYSGYRCLHEEYGLFQAAIYPRKNRPDISILNPGFIAQELEAPPGTTKLLIDVSVTKTLTVAINNDTQPAIKDARNTGLATISVFKRKWNQYTAAFNNLKKDNNNNTPKLGIIPFIMLTTGYIHKKSLSLLKLLAHKASAIHGIAYSVMYHRFKKIISCALQRGIGEAISARVANIGQMI